ncbi:NAD(P)-binding domain-containing protein [Chitinophaga pendula]|uniref:NAD(P)-dependent oxidoreductase n=1 Tax=Chitinophaga TaxID=79328 RepID=UPI000BAE7DEE|nr:MULTISPECIES: NAD(P)-binding domain-containing protein [Chitinophaga]ASZ12680.1 3-hydroxyisobutyrate dehydrogenase [Chitinophaga sp. MD30]UCJ09710.1 NAD(P)-binding domain-containing protein [Chitinophaga pendula]
MTTTTQQTGVTVIGLGDMGSVLAHVLLDKGYTVTVWNRRRDKAAALVARGAMLATDVVAAVGASAVTIICVTDYAISHGILHTAAVGAALSGRLLIELSTGTPADARHGERWAAAQGIVYLDGAILATPRQVGRADTPIFVSGDRAAYERGVDILQALAGGLQYMGEAPGAAAAWDLGFLSYLFMGALGLLHAARIFETEGIPVDGLGNMIAQVSPGIGEMIQGMALAIHQNDFEQPESSLLICALTMDLLIRQAAENGINDEMPRFFKGLYQRGLDAGYGGEKFAAMIKVLR